MSCRPGARLSAGLFLILAVLAGCGVLQTIRDRIRVEPLTVTPYHEDLTAKAQCMHCHTELASAPSVPHPHYENCAACHKVER